MHRDRHVAEGTTGVRAAEELGVDFHGGHWAHPAASLGFDSSRGEDTTRAAEGSGGDSNAFGDRLDSRAVILLGLVGEAEEGEEDEGADDAEPAGKFEGGFQHGVHSPDHSGDLVDAGESAVGVGPANPGPDAGVDVERNGVATEGDGAEDFNSGEAHKPDVSAGGEVVVAGKELIELRSALVEVHDAQDSIDSRNDTDDDWGAEHKDVGDPSVVGEGPAANVFEDVEAMALGDVICGYVRQAQQ